MPLGKLTGISTIDSDISPGCVAGGIGCKIKVGSLQLRSLALTSSSSVSVGVTVIYE
jgi:hypothetical protein